MFYYCPICTNMDDDEVVRFRSSSTRYEHLLTEHDKEELARTVASLSRTGR